MQDNDTEIEYYNGVGVGQQKSINHENSSASHVNKTQLFHIGKIERP